MPSNISELLKKFINDIVNELTKNADVFATEGLNIKFDDIPEYGADRFFLADKTEKFAEQILASYRNGSGNPEMISAGNEAFNELENYVHSLSLFDMVVARLKELHEGSSEG